MGGAKGNQKEATYFPGTVTTDSYEQSLGEGVETVSFGRTDIVLDL